MSDDNRTRKTSEDRLAVVLRAIYQKRSDEIRVSPLWLATEAMRRLAPKRKKVPELVYLAAHLQLRQVARSICRTAFEGDDADMVEQHEMFPDLQRRYPAARQRGDEPEYVLLEHMTEEDKDYNVKRMRRQSATIARRADALEAWWQDHHPAVAA